MKCVRGLFGVALVSFLNVNSSVAMSEVPEQVPNVTLPAQTYPMLIANPFNIIKDVMQTVEQVNQIRLQEERRQEAERRREDFETARREATEQQRLEAERRQQYFESLSPEEQQAYIEEQRAMQAQRQTEANLFLLMLGAMMFGGSDAGQQDDDRVCRNERQVGINDFATMTARQARGYGLVCD